MAGLHIRQWIGITSVIALLGVFSLMGCRAKGDIQSRSYRPLVQLHDQTLTAAQLHAIGIDTTDTIMTRHYIQRWVLERLIAQEAENKLPPEKLQHILQLVEEYRYSLLRNAMEEHIAQTRLDTQVTDEECRSYYDQRKESFQLQDTILQLRMLRIPHDKRLPRRWRTLLSSKYPADIQNLKEWCNIHRLQCALDDSTWLEWHNIKNTLPPKFKPSKARIGQVLRFHDKKYRYLLYLKDFQVPGDTPPFRYALPEIKARILYERKDKLITQYEQQLLHRALQSGQLKWQMQ